jgi:hypothetical protein
MGGDDNGLGLGLGFRLGADLGRDWAREAGVDLGLDRVCGTAAASATVASGRAGMSLSRPFPPVRRERAQILTASTAVEKAMAA